MKARPEPGDQLPELRVTPDRYLPHRYAGAALDFNPMHIDPEFARAAGLDQNLLHGMYTFGLLARAHTEAVGDPRGLRMLEGEFRAMAFPEREITVRTTVKEASGDRIVTETVAQQDDREVIRNASAVLELR
jgi:3-hydroxybutyryl-CoA dehydratase